MKRLMLILVASGLGTALTTGALGAHARSTLVPLPRWLANAEMKTLDRVFERARPTHTYYVAYPRKIAVIFEFKRVVICGACSAPSNASLPRGPVIRVSYDRQTHQPGNTMQFCESKGSTPPRSLCLRR
jgi:hypothetical protein